MLVSYIWFVSLVLLVSIVTTFSLPLHHGFNRKREVGQLSSFLEEMDERNAERPETLHPREAERDESMPERAQPCISIHYLMVLQNQFKHRIDPNGDGKATFDEVKNFLRHYQPHITNRVVNNFIQRRDLNGNGIIELIPEYILDITTPDYTQTGAREWFDLEDTDGDGFVSSDELETIALNVGMSRDEALGTVNTYYMTMDTNKDGKLSWDEYRALYRP